MSVELNVEGVEPTVAMFFVDVAEGLVKDPSIAKNNKGVIQFIINGSSSWVVDLRTPPGRVMRGTTRSADATVEYASVKAFEDINEGKRSVMIAFTTGAVKLTGDIAMVTKLIQQMDDTRKKAEAVEKEKRRQRHEKRDAELTPSYARGSGRGAASVASGSGRSSGTGASSSAAKTDWVDSKVVTACMGCHQMFSFTSWKHHCRACGGVFCHTCCPKRAPANQRVCNGCFASFYVHRGDVAAAAASSSSLRARRAVAQRRVASLAGTPRSVPQPSGPARRSAALPATAQGGVAGSPGPSRGSLASGPPSPAHAGAADAAAAAAAGGLYADEFADDLADMEPQLGLGNAGADAETAQLAERMAELEEKLRRLRQDAEAATLPLALPPSIEGAVSSSELASIVVYPLAYLLVLLGWRTVPLLTMLVGAWLWRAGPDWINVAAFAWLLAGGLLWYTSTASGGCELFRRRLRVFGAAGVVFVDYKLTQLRAADLQADESEPLYSAVHRRSAVRSLVIFRELQGLWVKLGQYLSSRADVIPDQYTEVYGALQDSMPARPLAEVQQTIEEDLGKPVSELFDGLQEEALAAASIGQVHRAKTKSGLDVAVKVKHRSIDRVLDQDLENLNIILGWMTFLEPDVDISTVMEEWSKEVRKELDLENEALQMIAVRENLIRDGLPVIVPRMPDRMFGKRVLVMRFIDGVKMSTPLPELDRMGVDREAMCRAVLRAFAHQIYVDGLFNGDPHPGNIMVIQRGALRDGDEEDVRYHREAARRRASSRMVPAAAGPAASPLDGADGTSVYSSATGGAAASADGAADGSAGVSPVMDGDATEWVPVLLDFGLTKLLPRHVRLAFCKMVLAGQELDGNMLMEAFDEMGMRFSNENVLEDMEGIKHMFRDALPKQEARAQNKAKMEEDEAKKAAAKSTGGEKRKIEAWPGELILFMRVSELLNGLAAQLEVRVPTMQIMSAAARVGMLRRFPMPRATLRPSAESVVASRLRITAAGGGSAARGGLRIGLFAEPMLNLPPLPAAHASSPGAAALARTPIELERVIRGSLKSLKAQGAILGAQVAVFKDGVCVADVATGQMGSLDHRRVAPESRFPVFGVGRALVAVALHEMALAGKLSLDAGVEAVWPEFADHGKAGCSVTALLRCRSGVEGWLPQKLTTSSLLDSEAMAAGVATAEPRLLPALAEFDRRHSAKTADAGDDEAAAPGATPDAAQAVGPAAQGADADAAPAAMEPSGDVLDLADKAEAAKAAARGRVPLKPAATWDMVPQGPSERHESCAHLYFGWSWSAAELLRRAASLDTAADALQAHVGAPLGIRAELRLGPVAAPQTGPGSTGALPEPVDGGGQDVGTGSPPDEDIFAAVATVELSSEDELRSAAKRAAREGSVSGAASERSGARTASRASLARSPSAGGLGGAGDATMLGLEAQEEEEDEAQADAHVMRTLMAAVAFHGALGSAGLGDLEGLISGGKEHLVDPRAVNAKRVRGAMMPGTTMFASARAVACAGASLMERLVQATGAKPYCTVTADASGALSCRLHDGPVPKATPTSVTVGAAAYEACSQLGFRICPFTRPDGAEEGRAFAMGGMGGSILLCDPASRVSVAITVNRLLPRRGQSKRLLCDIFTALSVGVPTEALSGAL